MNDLKNKHILSAIASFRIVIGKLVPCNSSTIINLEVHSTPCIKTCLEDLNMLPTSPILMLHVFGATMDRKQMM